ncbi:MAG: type II toxin-antitoxin system RelE/ParE family toxin [bacterium]
MKYEARWSEHALGDLRRLDLKLANRITIKVDWFCEQTKPLAFAKSLGGKFDDVYRFRVGDYRILFEIINGKVSLLMVLRVKHRREAYE